MADAILKSASDEISEGTALYLDGELTAVCSDCLLYTSRCV